MEILTALALEYQRDYGTAHGNLDFSDFVNNPFINSPSSVFGLGLKEKSSDLIIRKFAVLSDDRAEIRTGGGSASAPSDLKSDAINRSANSPT